MSSHLSLSWSWAFIESHQSTVFYEKQFNMSLSNKKKCLEHSPHHLACNKRDVGDKKSFEDTNVEMKCWDQTDKGNPKDCFLD